MEWKKLGRVYQPDGTKWWAKQHAMIPTPILLNDDVVRVFITCCDEQGIGRVSYVDLDARDPTKVVAVGEEPVLDIGLAGTFDENGALVCSVVPVKNEGLFMYYAGFELGTKIRYRLLTGLASQPAGEVVFKRAKQTPVLERSDKELFFRCGPFVLKDNNKFRMWYVAGSDWEQVGDATKPVYEIRYMESEDGIHWPDEGAPCIQLEKDNEHGFGRPYVIKEGGLYRMFYSVRRRDVESYRLGYAESQDGLSWKRKDDLVNLDVSDDGWDSSMICYSAVIFLHGHWYMFYNGDDFGRTGFGVAELVSW
jgi:predicted GH43/DUF377 family glycosyl hydrolase